MKCWFSSDLHFNHPNIIKYSKRPFDSTEQMDTFFINNFNSKIKKEDTVFFLGDFCFKNTKNGHPTHTPSYYKEKLNGNWIFIKGNHDNKNSLNTNIESSVIHYGGKDIWMCHNPEDANPFVEINLVGHVHNLWKIKKINNNSIMVNVGVDVWNYEPITINDIMNEIYKFKKTNKLIDRGDDMEDVVFEYVGESNLVSIYPFDKDNKIIVGECIELLRECEMHHSYNVLGEICLGELKMYDDEDDYEIDYEELQEEE